MTKVNESSTNVAPATPINRGPSQTVQPAKPGVGGEIPVGQYVGHTPGMTPKKV